MVVTERTRWLDNLRRDVAHAVRVGRRRLAFSVAVMLTLALGIGANTAVFSLINSIVLRPLPYPRAEQLFTLFEQDSSGASRQLASYPTFLDWREQSDVFSGLAFIRGSGLIMQAGDRTGFVLGSFVSEEFFRTLGVAALHGRALVTDDYGPNGGGVAVLSHAVWNSRFGAEPAVIGTTITLARRPYTVVGVMPPLFAYPNWGVVGTGIWVPIPGLPAQDMAALMQRGFHADSRIIARLENSEPLVGAQSQMDAIARRLSTAYPESSSRWTRVSIDSLIEFTVGNVQSLLFMLGGAVVLVLLICCVNLANLYLAHGTERQREFAIRAALGAGRPRVLVQLLVETLLPVSVGGALGTAFAIVTVRVVRVAAAARLPRMNEVTVDLPVLMFAAGITVFTAVLFAGLASRRVGASDLARSLTERDGGGQSAGTRGRLPGWLLSGQVALTVVLLIGAALLTQSLWRLSNVDPGFDPHNLAVLRITPPSPQYDDAQAVTGLYDRVAQSIAQVPGVSGVALINHAPVGSGGLPSRAAIGQAPTGTSDDIDVLFLTVSAEYFSMMGIPVLAGREFSAADLNGPPGPVIVNDVLARRWGETPAVGQRLGVLKAARTRPDFGQPLMGTVVGVVGDLRHFGLESEPSPMVYVPYTHNPWSEMAFLVRTESSPGPLLSAVENAVRRVEPAIPLEGLGQGASTMADRVRRSYATQRLNAALVGAFAFAALLLAAVGIYGVMSYTVALQTREIGIRIALGAAPGAMMGAIVGRVLRITALGLIAGVLAAVGLTRLITSLLYQVAPTDPVTYGVVAVVFVAVAVAAGYVPARRAAAVDPVRALRA
ncbi:MAG: ABC transporter permease [Gemmatimonadetes bacterium]|nr:ABC transporter permease [Gemmatimonadota bacterium]